MRLGAEAFVDWSVGLEEATCGPAPNTSPSDHGFNFWGVVEPEP